MHPGEGVCAHEAREEKELTLCGLELPNSSLKCLGRGNGVLLQPLPKGIHHGSCALARDLPTRASSRMR